MSSLFFEVGALVRHRDAPEWGLGQVQSIVGERVTVNFEHEGKVVLLNAEALEVVEQDTL